MRFLIDEDVAIEVGDYAESAANATGGMQTSPGVAVASRRSGAAEEY